MENRARRSEHEILYVYDRICPKESKRRELYNQYGVKRSATVGGKQGAARPHTDRGRINDPARKRAESSPRRNPSATKPRADSLGDTRTFDRISTVKTPPRAHHRRAESNGVHNGNVRSNERARTERSSRPNYKSASTGQAGGSSRAYTYRPGSPSVGGDTVAANPLKFLREKIVSFFESVEERRNRDELSAKRQAIARKKLYEHRHTIGTALLVLLILAAFVFFVYKMFFVITEIDASGSTVYDRSTVIASSGINEGDNLYSFSTYDAENSITFHCPYIKSAEITRTMPHTVSITVSEDTAMYVANIWGEDVILSAGMRVLGYADGRNTDGLTEIILPPIDYAVAGRVITFSDTRDERYVREVLSSVLSDTYFSEAEIDRIDLTNSGDIRIFANGKYILRLGSDVECTRKLRMAEKTLTDTSFDKTKPATIDLTKVGEASVRYDPKLFEN